MQPRQLNIHPKTRTKLYRLWQDACSEGSSRVAERIHAVILNGEGKTSGEISNLVKSSRAQVSLWLKRYDEHGFEALLEGHRSGRPAGMSKNFKRILGDIVDSGPVAYGYMSGVWTAPMIAEIIQTEFNLEYHPGHVRKLLKRIGFSVQRPKRQLVNADPAKQQRWTRYTYPNLKKRPNLSERP